MKTAVQWLVEQYLERKGFLKTSDIERALEMEKEQIEAAYKRGKRHKKPLKDSNPINKFKSE